MKAFTNLIEHTTKFELRVISKLVKKFDPKRFFEIGAFQGRTTLNMTTNIRQDGEIITLDLSKND